MSLLECYLTLSKVPDKFDTRFINYLCSLLNFFFLQLDNLIRTQPELQIQPIGTFGWVICACF